MATCAHLAPMIKLVDRRRKLIRHPKDIFYFLHWESLVVLAGTLVLAVLELNLLPASLPFTWFVNDWKILFLVIAAALVVLPPALVKGLLQLRRRRDAGTEKRELELVLEAIQGRVGFFIEKMREAFAGQKTKEYQKHVLLECRRYFETRPHPKINDLDESLSVEVSFYAVDKRSQTTMLSRKLFTHNDPSIGRAQFSQRGTPDSKLCVESILAGEIIFCDDVLNPQTASRLKILDGAQRTYRTFLSVPIYRDRKSADPDRIIGMLSVNASSIHALQESDSAMILTYGWFLSAALEADNLADAQASRGQ